MTKIQIIIDDGESLKGLTCQDVEISRLTPTYQELYASGFDKSIQEFHFVTRSVDIDYSPNLISIPNELLLRIRDYNIDTEHKNAINETLELKKRIDDLKAQVAGWETRRDLIIEEYERYHALILNMIDRYPMAAAEICLQDGNLDAACYFAQKANEEETDNV